MSEFLWMLAAVGMVWLGWRMIRGNPGLFSREALGKSFYVLGILALILIAVIAICVCFLRRM